jgi:2-keto-3-deoxy-L-rhamnonate aldolase RhmA
MPHDDYVVQKLRGANERTLVIALIESAAGIANAEAIMAVESIDIGWLANSMPATGSTSTYTSRGAAPARILASRHRADGGENCT